MITINLDNSSLNIIIIVVVVIVYKQQVQVHALNYDLTYQP